MIKHLWLWQAVTVFPSQEENMTDVWEHTWNMCRGRCYHAKHDFNAPPDMPPNECEGRFIIKGMCHHDHGTNVGCCEYDIGACRIALKRYTRRKVLLFIYKQFLHGNRYRWYFRIHILMESICGHETYLNATFVSCLLLEGFHTSNDVSILLFAKSIITIGTQNFRRSSHCWELWRLSILCSHRTRHWQWFQCLLG